MYNPTNFYFPSKLGAPLRELVQVFASYSRVVVNFSKRCTDNVLTSAPDSTNRVGGGGKD